ncbi:MAG: hypothetical protein AAGU32_20860, partial [Bacillota bacterium]
SLPSPGCAVISLFKGRLELCAIPQRLPQMKELSAKVTEGVTGIEHRLIIKNRCKMLMMLTLPSPTYI